MFLRRFGRPSMMMMANVKETTTGIIQSELNVVPNAREFLIDLYSKTLNEVKGIPKHYRCRKVVESSTIYRLKVCQEEEDLEKIHKRIGSGQVDELIDEAKEDLRLIGEKKDLCKVVGSLLIKLNELEETEDEVVEKERQECLKKEYYDYLNALKADQDKQQKEKESQERLNKEYYDYLEADDQMVAEKHEWEVWSDPPEPEPEIQPSPAPPEEHFTLINLAIKMEESKKKESEERTKKERELRETKAKLKRVLLELV